MPSFLVANTVAIVFSVVFGIHGIIINSTVLTMYIRLWRNVTSPGVSDQILFSMALIGLFLQCFLLINSVVFALEAKGTNTHSLLLLSTYAASVVYIISFWNTTWLSIFYCVKLVNTSHRLLLQFKSWFLSSIKKLLIGSAVSLVVITLPFFWKPQLIFLQNATRIDESLGFKMEVNIYYRVCVLLIGVTLPFILTVLCIGLSLSSILHHVWRIRRNVPEFRSSPQLQALVRAVVTMTLHVALNLIFFIIFVYSNAMSFHTTYAAGIIIGLFLQSYPSMQCFVTLFGNPRLRRIILGQETTSEVIKSFEQ